jgi:hypothetical protein
METGSLLTWMVIFTKEIGSMTRLTGTECTFTLMGLAMKACGKMIYNMDKERKHGLMDQFMKASIMRVRNTDLAFTVGTTALGTRENGLRIKSVV